MTAAARPGGPASVQPDEIDRLRPGRQAEVAFHEAATGRMRQANAGADTMAALGELIDGESAKKGAEAAGQLLERYQELEVTVAQALGARPIGERPSKKDMAESAPSAVTPE